MNVLFIEPGKVPKSAEIEPTLENYQKLVGGHIEAIYPFEDKVALVCDEESKLKSDTLWNRALGDYDIIKGPFFICGLGEEDFTDLSPELTEKYKKIFQNPEVFLPSPKGLTRIVLKTPLE